MEIKCILFIIFWIIGGIISCFTDKNMRNYKDYYCPHVFLCIGIFLSFRGIFMLEAGTKAPDFKLQDQNGNYHTLSEYSGKKLILYFYSKDNTSGCTKQACGFSELYPQFTEKDAVVVGVSKDTVASHKKFEEKYGLKFTLLANPELDVLNFYDVWKEKCMYGKITMGVVRTTYLIEDGIITKAFGKVKAAENPQQMLDELSK